MGTINSVWPCGLPPGPRDYSADEGDKDSNVTGVGENIVFQNQELTDIRQLPGKSVRGTVRDNQASFRGLRTAVLRQHCFL